MRAVTREVARFPRAIIDVNGDGKRDAVVAHAMTNMVGVLLNRGDGSFADELLFRTERRPVFVTGSDIDKDGLVDLVVTNRLSSTVSVLLQER